MFRKSAILVVACAALMACAQEQPRIIQPTANASEIRLSGGMATQVEVPNGSRVQSVTVGDPTLITAEHVDNVVNLVPKNKSGDTNMIVRTIDNGGDVQVYQYRINVQGH
ncbi:MAG TPA: hypothetical protein VFR09_03465 [Alphaproteobacteria bacterium]|nr:hypothetical protein [Alphaproteobacteria bacterium]